MEIVTLDARERKDTSKSARNKIRKEGRVPGVFYSKHISPVSIDVEEKSLHKLVFTSKAHLISLKMDGMEEQECIVKDVQFDPLTDEVLHFDLLGLTRGEKIQLEVPVQLQGNAVGVREGGVLQHILHKLEVECLPRNIPEHLPIKISDLKIGDSIHVKDLNYDDVVILNGENSIVVAVTHPKVKEEPVPVEGEVAEAEEGAEPELISKRKPEEEEKEE